MSVVCPNYPQIPAAYPCHDLLKERVGSVVLMDISMPEVNGIEATRQVIAGHPDVAVILCSTHDPKDLPAGAAASGAIAYVSKEHPAAGTIRELWDRAGERRETVCASPVRRGRFPSLSSRTNAADSE